jgi:FKBP-type peptidyl-prolyl cis-trans isomerase
VRTLLKSCLHIRFARHAFAACIGLLTLTSCLNLDVPGPSVPSDQPSDPAKETFDAALGIDLSKMQRTPSGVYYKDGPLGSGATLNGVGTIVLSFVGYLKTGAVFQQGTNVQVILGNEIRGLQEGMQGMHEGGERLLVIPSALGFGSIGAGPVAPNTTLVYDVILKIIP